jgi:hypothetical protein
MDSTNYDSDSSDEYHHENMLEPQVILDAGGDYGHDMSDDEGDNASNSSLLEVQIDDR